MIPMWSNISYHNNRQRIWIFRSILITSDPSASSLGISPRRRQLLHRCLIRETPRNSCLVLSDLPFSSRFSSRLRPLSFNFRKSLSLIFVRGLVENYARLIQPKVNVCADTL